MTSGIDCASKLNPTTAGALAVLGYKFVGRYLGDPSSWKSLEPAEVKAISNAGMNIVSLYETTANRAAGGTANGIYDGAEAFRLASNIGQPLDTVICMTVDFDASKNQLDTVEEYLSAARTMIPGYKLGVYAEYEVIEAMAERGVADMYWQTYAWSGGKRSKHNNIYQYRNDVGMVGISVDLNESYGNEGWWNMYTEQPTDSSFPDVPHDHWAKAAIEVVKNLHLMVGTSGGLFEPDRPITRAETAAMLNNLVYELNKVLPTQLGGGE